MLLKPLHSHDCEANLYSIDGLLKLPILAVVFSAYFTQVRGEGVYRVLCAALYTTAPRRFNSLITCLLQIVVPEPTNRTMSSCFRGGAYDTV